ncbi:putative serine dehydratase domain-containing protein [Colletotrichum navitas]|uniref:D-serine dehydratase n=1 Tax=Colletotrichum navitas TaxID=681940 RepID=A0AAD8V682_9PEZI|nr:putative serine dehydratase domain-containing protein [Colletotrichum navitas]KAK1594108.1 putative serine dehydratase domain-containing protein [Colletotrichum navitas]
MSIPQRIAPPLESLRKFYVGRDVHSVPKPAAVLDAAKVRRHCQSMLDGVDALEVGFRAHAKTHKTKEVTRLQAGEKHQQVNFIVSTVAEIEHLLSVFQDYKDAGRDVNVLYGVPLLGSQVDRLATLSKQLGRNGLTVMTDHPSQLESVKRLQELTGFPVDVFLKVDTGYHRAGLPPAALNKGGLLEQLIQLDAESRATFVGVYSHSSLSYMDTTADKAMHNLAAEVEGCLEALHANADLLVSKGPREVVISVGATPQVTAIENVTAGAAGGPGGQRLREAITKAKTVSRGGLRSSLELHAGVYSVLDMQQMSTRSRTDLGSYEDEVAITVVAEVCSVYNDGEREKPEALVAVGTLGLGREPCPSYSGWGVSGRLPFPGSEDGCRLVVERISQEHSILSWDSDPEKGTDLPPIPLEVGQTISIYPNHACVTGALYGWYLVVDSSRPNQTEVVDVWVRGFGW